jgi:hypothetical protein
MIMNQINTMNLKKKFLLIYETGRSTTESLCHYDYVKLMVILDIQFFFFGSKTKWQSPLETHTIAKSRVRTWVKAISTFFN